MSGDGYEKINTETFPNEMSERDVRKLESELKLGMGMILLDTRLQELHTSHHAINFDDHGRLLSLMEIKYRILQYVRASHDMPDQRLRERVPEHFRPLADEYLQLFKELKNDAET